MGSKKWRGGRDVIKRTVRLAEYPKQEEWEGGVLEVNIEELVKVTGIEITGRQRKEEDVKERGITLTLARWPQLDKFPEISLKYSVITYTFVEWSDMVLYFHSESRQNSSGSLKTVIKDDIKYFHKTQWKCIFLFRLFLEGFFIGYCHNCRKLQLENPSNWWEKKINRLLRTDFNILTQYY